MYKYLLLNKINMTIDGYTYTYPGLNTSQFAEIKYSEDASQAVVKTAQEDIPEGIQQITEMEFNQYVEQWPQPEPPQPAQQQSGITLAELNEKVDLLIQMQLEREGIL